MLQMRLSGELLEYCFSEHYSSSVIQQSTRLFMLQKHFAPTRLAVSSILLINLHVK